ncbi:MAG: FecCD family ABC transporter permease [Promethearchaeota archaeon]
MRRRYQLFLTFFLIILLILSIFFSLTIGSVSIPFSHSLGILLDALGISTSIPFTPTEQIIVLSLRLPRVLMAVLIGAMLSIAGVASQNLFKNPIADPYIIGISSSAGFGAAFATVLGVSFFGKFTLPFISFFFALGTIFFIYQISKKKDDLNVSTLLLSGIALSYLFSALISLLLFLAENTSHLILSVLMGNFWGIGWDEVYISTLVLLPSGLLLYLYGLDMNLLLMGDDAAKSMGLNVKRSKIVIIFGMTILTATAVAFCGSIGFVGLIVPHITRMIFGSDNGKIIPKSAIIGAILLIWADVMARTLSAPLEIPVSVFTSFMGGPFFIWLVIKQRKRMK